MAANYKANPFTLTYDGAIRENVKGQVNLHTVHYPANGIEAAANVYTPANFDPAKRYPAIVVAHPNGGVKEQVAGLYAQKLAEAGYVTIAFDAAYQGASGGKPRYIDKPQFRIEDIRAAAATSVSTRAWTQSASACSASAAAGATPSRQRKATSASRRWRPCRCSTAAMHGATASCAHKPTPFRSAWHRPLPPALRKWRAAKCSIPLPLRQA